MARRIEVDIIGDASSLQRAFKETANGAARFEAKVTGSMHNIARSAVVAAGAFVGFSAAGEAFKTVIGAAVDAERSQRQLAAQLKANRENFRASAAAITDAGLKMGRFGFTIEDSEKALTILDRGTKNITQSIRLQGVAANLARAKNIDLASAAGALAKVFGGQETALRRAVPGLSKHAHGLELIYEAAKRLTGQASAGTTAEERFHAVLHDTEVVIGTALLPTVNRYLDRLSAWLERMNRSGRLQKDVNQALQTATGIVNALKGPVEALAGAFKALGDAVGGTKNEVKLLLEVFAGFKLAQWIRGLGLLSGGIGRVGSSAKTAKGELEGLRGAALGLGAPATIAAIVLFTQYLRQISGGVGKGFPNLPGYDRPSVLKGTPLLDAFNQAPGSYFTGYANQVYQRLHGNPRAFERWLEQHPGGWSQIQGVDLAATPAGKAILKQLRDRTVYTVTGFGTRMPGAGGVTGLPGGVHGIGNAPLNAYQQLQLGLAADPSNVGLLRQKIARDRSAVAFAQRLRQEGRITNAKYLTEVTAYYNDINANLATIASLQKKAAAGQRIHLPAVVSGSGAIAGLGAFRRTERQSLLGGFQAYLRSYGLLAQYQTPLGLQVAQSRAGALGLDESGILRRIRNAARRALESGRLALTAQMQAWDIIASVNQQLGTQAIKFRRSLAGTQPGYAGAGGARFTIHELHLHGVQDMNQLENQLEARAKRRPQPRRGR